MSRTFPLSICCRAKLWTLLPLLLASCGGPGGAVPAVAQWAPDSSTVRLPAGRQYARGAAWQFFWGKHYRDIWATPVTVSVMRLATALPGGLRPMQAGGSYQSRTLRLCASTGREYVLRSVDKDASAALHPGMARKLLGGLMKDQTSATQPYGAYVAAQLAEAAGVYHTNPRLVYIANDPALGKFRAAYANALYLFEERPEGRQVHQASFGHSPAVVNTNHMLTEIHKRPTAQAAARAYLRARLLDMWLGDWSRREDQWRWASFAQAGRVTYRPIPRDRDQAFFLFNDGVVTRLVSWFVPKYHSFRGGISPGSVDGLTSTARVLDRTLLSSLSADDFRQEADSLRRRLSDAAIARALQAGPAETQAAIAARFAPVMRARREDLPAAAARLYRLLAAEAWLIGTDQAERFVLAQNGAGRLRVRVLALRPGQPDSLILERGYDRRETRKLILYGLAGNDIFELDSNANPGFAVHLYPGAGQDKILQRGTTPGSVSGFTWFRRGAPNAVPGIPGLKVKADPDSALTANHTGWLRRYRLND